MGMTNLSIVLLLSLMVVATALTLYSTRNSSVSNRILTGSYQLVRSIIKENLVISKQQYIVPLFYLFCVIVLANLIGLTPFAFTTTSSFVITFFFSATFFVGINIIAAWKQGWRVFELFLPGGAPLEIVPFLIFIEAVSYIARVFSLSIRLFANMMSGHALLKILIGFSTALLAAGALFLAPFPWIIVTAITCLELLIALLQGYVFVILVVIYINDVLNMHGE
jgi:F-type H+-transporting ATPase subunit a